MDMQIVQRGLDLTRRRKKWLLLLAAFGVTGYGAYKVYYLPSVVKKRKRLWKLIEALISVVEVVSDSSEIIGVVSKDLKQFLQSDSDEIPTSLKQISKIAKSEEFSESLIRVTQGLTVGILRGYKFESKDGDESQSDSDFSDRIMDKVFSTAGSGFASVVVGSFARNLVMTFYSDDESGGSKTDMDSQSIPKWVNVVCSDKCKDLIADSIQLFVSTAVAVYLEKTENINFYDEVFTGLTNPKHESKVRDVLVSLCNGAVETLIRTSHQVMTASDSNSNSNMGSNSMSSRIDRSEGSSMFGNEDFYREAMVKVKEKNSSQGIEDSGWLSKVSSTLAVPKNRRLVLDVTGRVTFETVRSFLDFLMRKTLDGVKRSFDVVHVEIVERGLDVMRYISAKSALIVTVCFAFCLHLVGGARVLLPASSYSY
ncbi:hypothetical protein MKX01_019436 [Papaver californicum]|nr:hypothetical protein MKX01_019436 [Papaver californicum]